MEPTTAQAQEPAVYRIHVDRWPTELPLLILVALASAAIWLLLLVSIFGIIYAVLIGVFFFFAHLAFITHIRGSAVKLGPRQFPELHARVVELSRRAGLATIPDAYVMQAGGSLNALATKLFRGRMIVLFSDLLDACGDDHAARDMVIGHEIGHLRSGHLDWFTVLAPGRFTPFLGAAYSRACEYTCDRWGAALCGDRAGAARGLAILAAGGRHGPRVNLEAFVEQRRELDSGWLTIGRWMSGYPPLASRIAAVEPSTSPVPYTWRRGPMRAAGILAAIVMIPTIIMIGLTTVWLTQFKPFFDTAIAGANPPGAGDDSAFEERAEVSPLPEAEVAAARLQVEADFATIEAVLREHHGATGEVIPDGERLGEVWSERRPGVDLPPDPFDGYMYLVTPLEDGTLELMSSGPDAMPDTEDDIRYRVALTGGVAAPDAANN
jgi:Zn-dependent protease with chaperone function